MTKRRNGEGSWGKRIINGNNYFYYKNPEGKFFYGKSQAEVEEKIKNQKSKTKKITNKMTFGEYVKKWLYERKYRQVGITLQSTTFDTYEDALNIRFFKNNISNRQLASLNHNVITDYLKELSNKYSRASIRKTWVILRMALQDNEAEGYEYIPNILYNKVLIPSESNVAVKKRVVNFTSNEDMDKIYIEAMRKTSRDTYVYSNAAFMIVFIMYSGLRLSEACGLKWENVDLENEMITITTQTTKIRTRDETGQPTGYIVVDKAPKTEESARYIPYRRRAGEILLLLNSNIHDVKDYIFINKNGKPYTRRLVERTLERILDNTDCSTKEYTVHSLRHGYGSILYQEGIDIKTISELLGHSDIAVTANIYVGVTPKTLKDALRKVDEQKK